MTESLRLGQNTACVEGNSKGKKYETESHIPKQYTFMITNSME